MDDSATLQQLIRESHATNESLTKLNLQMARILKLLDGDVNEDIAGIRPRLQALEKQMNVFPVDTPNQLQALTTKVSSLQDEAAAWKNRYLGAKWVLTFLGLTNVATIIAVLRILLGAH